MIIGVPSTIRSEDLPGQLNIYNLQVSLSIDLYLDHLHIQDQRKVLNGFQYMLFQWPDTTHTVCIQYHHKTSEILGVNNQNSTMKQTVAVKHLQSDGE